MIKIIKNRRGVSFKLIYDKKDKEIINLYHLRASFKGDRYYIQGHKKGDNSKNVKYLHRLIMGACRGQVVDHINNNTLDCRRKNLRLCTQGQNLQNRQKARGVYTSKYKGVSWSQRDNRWRVRITKNKICVYCGYFREETEAVKAYNKMAKRVFGSFAYLNN